METSINRVANWTTIIVTLLALPGYFSLFNDWFRKVMENHDIIPYLLLVAILIVCFEEIAYNFGWFKSKNLERITGRMFHNQTVEIDNKNFEDCKFDTVTFRYRGGPYVIIRANISGTTTFETSDLGARGAVDLLKLLNWLEPNFAASWKSRSPEDFKKSFRALSFFGS